jgi:hypothetical protein
MGNLEAADKKKLAVAVALLTVAIAVFVYFMLPSGGPAETPVAPVDVLADPNIPANRGFAPGAK